MELGELITALEVEDPRKVVPHGFGEPHCWRWDYSELAFDPAQNVTVASMLAHARSAVGTTYQGWKGGDYTMALDSDCYLAEPREIGETLGPTLLRLMLAAGTIPAETDAPPGTGTLTVYASIGNSDDRLTQAQWSGLTRRLANEVNQHADRVHGVWYSAPDSRYQNACACFEVTEKRAAYLRECLALACRDFRQESIAWAVVQGTEFIAAGEAADRG